MGFFIGRKRILAGSLLLIVLLATRSLHNPKPLQAHQLTSATDTKADRTPAQALPPEPVPEVSTSSHSPTSTPVFLPISEPAEENGPVPSDLLSREPEASPSIRPSEPKRPHELTEQIRDPVTILRSWITLGLGVHLLQYRESGDHLRNGKFASLSTPSVSIETGASLNDQFGVLASYKTLPSVVEGSAGADIRKTEFAIKTLSLEGLYGLKPLTGSSRSGSEIFLSSGLQGHQWPWLIPLNDDSIEIVNFQVISVSLGLNFKYWVTPLSHFKSGVHFQYPLYEMTTRTSDSISLDPEHSLDGFLGYSVSLTERLRLGLNWNLQWHKFNVEYFRARDAFRMRGDEEILSSNLELTLGWDF